MILLDHKFNMKNVFDISFYWGKPARRAQPEFSKFDQSSRQKVLFQDFKVEKSSSHEKI